MGGEHARCHVGFEIRVSWVVLTMSCLLALASISVEDLFDLVAFDAS